MVEQCEVKCLKSLSSLIFLFFVFFFFFCHLKLNILPVNGNPSLIFDLECSHSARSIVRLYKGLAEEVSEERNLEHWKISSMV